MVMTSIRDTIADIQLKFSSRQKTLQEVLHYLTTQVASTSSLNRFAGNSSRPYKFCHQQMQQLKKFLCYERSYLQSTIILCAMDHLLVLNNKSEMEVMGGVPCSSCHRQDMGDTCSAIGYYTCCVPYPQSSVTKLFAAEEVVA